MSPIQKTIWWYHIYIIFGGCNFLPTIFQLYHIGWQEVGGTLRLWLGEKLTLWNGPYMMYWKYLHGNIRRFGAVYQLYNITHLFVPCHTATKFIISREITMCKIEEKYNMRHKSQLRKYDFAYSLLCRPD